MGAVTNASGENIDAAEPDALGAEEVELGGAESGELRHALGEVLDPEGDREVRSRHPCIFAHAARARERGGSQGVCAVAACRGSR